MAFTRSAVRSRLSPQDKIVNIKIGANIMLNLVKIREKSQILLGTLLFFFILSMTAGGLVGGANIMDIIFDKGDNGGRYVGKVGSTKITRQQFLNARSNQLSRLRQQNTEITNSAIVNAENNAWNTIVDETLVNEKVKSMGLESFDDEIYNFMFFTPPVSLQNQLTEAGFFMDSDNNFDIELYQNALSTGTYEVDPSFWLAWENYLKTFLPNRKLQNIYNLVGSVSNEDVKNEYIKRNINCKIEYIYVNSNNIPDSLIQISEQDIVQNYNENKEERYLIEKSKKIEYVLFENVSENEEDSLQNAIYEKALLFSEGAKFTSFSESVVDNNFSIGDTLNITESYTNNSGIPRDLGTLRNLVRFCFDNPTGSITDPIETNKGYAVFHVIEDVEKSYKSLDEVRNNISNQLMREFKLNYAERILENLDLSQNDLKSLSSNNELIKYVSEDEKNINSSFTDIGKSSSLTGTLMALNSGETSRPIKTFNSSVIVKMIEKDTFNEEDYLQERDELKNQLSRSKKTSGYNNWLTDLKKLITIEDYRSSIF